MCEHVCVCCVCWCVCVCVFEGICVSMFLCVCLCGCVTFMKVCNYKVAVQSGSGCVCECVWVCECEWVCDLYKGLQLQSSCTVW